MDSKCPACSRCENCDDHYHSRVMKEMVDRYESQMAAMTEQIAKLEQENARFKRDLTHAKKTLREIESIAYDLPDEASPDGSEAAAEMQEMATMAISYITYMPDPVPPHISGQ